MVQVTNYYAWGSVYGDMCTGASLQPYKYGDKELDLTAGVARYDYAARAYYAAIPRFDRPDALAGKYPHISPYAFCANNPVNVTDPTGGEVKGVSKQDADKLVQDFRAMFPGDDLTNFRNLIVRSGKKQKGKSLAPITDDALNAALNGITLNEDQQALIEIAVNAINSDDEHYVEYRNNSDNLSNKVENAYLPGFLASDEDGGISQILEVNGGLPVWFANAFGGAGTTVRTKKGSHSVIVNDAEHPNGRAVTTGHEVLGHGRSMAVDHNDDNQHFHAVQTENLILRVMGIPFIRTGADHSDKQSNGEFPGHSKLPNFR